MATITGIKAGTTTITASYGGKTATASITVSAIAPTLTFTVNSTSLTYNGSAQKLGTVTYNGDGTAYYYISTSNSVPSATESGWTAIANGGEVKYTNAGTYYVHLKATAGNNYTAVNPKLGNSTGKAIAKRTVYITAPTLVSGTLTYNGSAQNIANAGSCSTGGTMYYYVSTSSTAPTVTSGSAPGTGWSTTLSKQTNKGTYYIWYYCYVSDTANNTGTDINTVKSLGSKAIGVRTVTITAPTVSNKTYNGSAQTIFSGGSCSTGGTMYFSDTNKSFSTSYWSTTIPTPQRTNAGTYTLYYYAYVSDTTNNTGTGINTIKSVQATIAKKSTSSPALTAGGVTTYTGTIYYAKAANVSGNPAGTIYYGTTAGATTYSMGVAAGATTATNMSSMGRANVGTTTIHAFFRPTDTTNYEDSGDVQTTVTITNKATGYATANTFTPLTYNGSAQDIATVKTNSGDYYFGLGSSTTTAPTSWGTKNTKLSQTNAGTYYVWMKTDASTNYNAVSAKYINTVVINKRTVTITAPTKTNRTYNAAEQVIFDAGSCTTGGVMYYNTSNTTFSTSSWSTTIPYTKKTNAGTYTIYWYCYVADTANNQGTDINTIKSLSATIEKASTTAPTLTKGEKTTYDGGTVYAKAASASSNPAGKIYYGASSGATTYSISVSAGSTTATNMTSMSQTSVGSKTIYAFFRPTDTANYKDSSVVSTTVQVINKANLTVTEVNYSGTYDGSSHSSTITVTNDDWTGKTIVCGTSTSYGTTVTSNGVADTAYALKTATNYTDSTTIYYKVTGDTNYNDYADSVTFAIAKATGYATASTANKTYNGSAQTIATKSTNSGDYYFGISTSSTTAPTSWGAKNAALSATNAGTYYVWMKADASTNYNAVAAKYIDDAVISKRTVTITAPTRTNRDYTGAEQTIFTAGSATAGGVMYYSTSDTSFTTSTWSTTIPYTKKTNVGTYTIYWYCYVADTANNQGTGINTKNTLTATISKVSATLPTVWQGDAKDYDTANGIGTTASPASLTYSGYSGGTIKFRYDVNGGTNYGSATTTPPTRTAVGNTTVQCMVEGDANHTSTGWSEVVTLTVNAETDAMMTVTLQSRTYTGSAQVIATGSKAHGISSYKIGYIRKDIGATAPSQPTADSQVTWAAANSNLSATNAGDYYVYYSFTPDAGHSNSKTREYVGKVTIAKKSRSGAVTFTQSSTTVTSTTYPNTVTASVSGNTETGTVTWSVTNGTGKATVNSSGVVTPTQAGTVTVTASVAETANYLAYTASKQLTINKAQGTITYTTYTDVEEYCRRDAVPGNKTNGAKEITIAATSASGATGTISYAISQSGWTISSDGKKITVPDQTPAGTYNITVSATSAESTNYLAKTVSNQITVRILEQKLERIELLLADDTIPFNGTTTATVVAVYTTGITADVTSNSGTTYSSNPDDIVTITK